MPEFHPFLNQFPIANTFQKLIIGTFPPLGLPNQNYSFNQFIEKNVGGRGMKYKCSIYYGSKRNNFWRLLSNLFDETRLNSQENNFQYRYEFLGSINIGIIDTIQSCDRRDGNANDINLINRRLNQNIQNLIITSESNLIKLFFTGRRSAGVSAYERFLEILNIEDPNPNEDNFMFNYGDKEILVRLLPSPSPNSIRFGHTTFPEMLNEYESILL